MPDGGYHPNISELAEDLLEQTGGNVREATDKLTERAREDSKIYFVLTEPFLSQACYYAVRKVCQRERRAIWTAPNYVAGGNGERVENHARSLLMFQLPTCGKYLRDAMKDDVQQAAHFYREQAEDMDEKGRWLDEIARNVKGDKTVGEQLDEQALWKLRTQKKRRG